MKIAISSSLQGYPEESSPGDPLDTRRLGIYVAEHLQALFPQIEVELYNRDDFPGTGDDYLELRDAVTRWGADIHVSIHQDAYTPESRGWCILYYHAEALSLANELVSTMAPLPSPFKGVRARKDAAVLKRPNCSVIIEAGFYTSADDEAIGVAGWGDPIVKGITNYLGRHLGIYPQTKSKGDDEVIEFVKQDEQEAGQGALAGETVDVWSAYGGGSDYIHARVNGAGKADLVAFAADTATGVVYMAELESDAFAGTVRQVHEAIPGTKPEGYYWISLHMMPEDSARFRGFVRP